MSEAASTISDSRCAWSELSSAEDAPGGGEERVEVVEAPVRLAPDPVVGAGEALDHRLQVGDGGLVEGVEELVEVDLGGGVDLRDRRRRSRSARRRARRAGRGRRSGWRSPTATGSGSWRGCPRAAARSPSEISIFTSAWPSSASVISLIEPAGTPATLTGVARDQLAGVLELGGDGVGGAAAEHEEQQHDDRAPSSARTAATRPTTLDVGTGSSTYPLPVNPRARVPRPSTTPPAILPRVLRRVSKGNRRPPKRRIPHGNAVCTPRPVELRLRRPLN